MKIGYGRVLVFVVASMALVGCIPRQDTASRQVVFSELQSSVGSYADMRFAMIDVGSGTDFEIRPNDPAFDFGEDGVSYFRAFELPATEMPYRVVVKSYKFATDCYPCREGYFFPVVRFLNASYEPVSVVEHAPGKFYPGLNRARWETIYEVRPENAAKYAVVHTARRYMHGQMPDRQMLGTAIMPTPGVFVPIGGGNISTKPLPTGSLRIEIE
jgi:hypothetical protein